MLIETPKGHNKLRDLFLDPEGKQKKRLEEIMKEAEINQYCSTCKHYIPVDPYLPGFVSAFPECKLGGLAMEHCGKYERGDTNA